MPPPPWELSRIPRPSMLDGLHRKLLGNGLWALAEFAPQPLVALLLPCRSRVPTGKVSAANGLEPGGNTTPLPRTVIAAPSSAPIRVGSCSNWARLPLRVASHPTTASSGWRSICGLLADPVKFANPDAHEFDHVLDVPLSPSPNRQLTLARQASSLPAG